MKLELTFMTKDYTRKNSMSKKFDGTEEGGGGGQLFQNRWKWGVWKFLLQRRGVRQNGGGVDILY